MVASLLQDDLVGDLHGIFKGFRSKGPDGALRGLSIFPQGLPMPEPLSQEGIPPEQLENGLVQEVTARDPFPYIIVRIDDGEYKDVDSAHMVNVSLLFGVCEPSYDKQGHKDILNMIDDVYERFAKMPVLNGRYTIQYPITWVLQEEASHPYYFGGMSLIFEAAAVRREDPFS